MTQLAESVANLIEQFAKLPGVGKKSAERLAYHVLRVNKAEAFALADAIRDVRNTWQFIRDRRPETYGDMVELLP